MASTTTKYTAYTTTDKGVTLSYLGEAAAYSRKEAIQRILADHDDATVADGRDVAELRQQVESGEDVPSFLVAPTSTFVLVTPKVETKVEVTF